MSDSTVKETSTGEGQFREAGIYFQGQTLTVTNSAFQKSKRVAVEARSERPMMTTVSVSTFINNGASGMNLGGWGAPITSTIIGSTFSWNDRETSAVDGNGFTLLTLTEADATICLRAADWADYEFVCWGTASYHVAPFGSTYYEAIRALT